MPFWSSDMAGDQYIDEEQMRQYLRQAYAGDPEGSLLWQLARRVEDPVMPKNEKGKRRLHPLLRMLAALALVVAGTFFYFGVRQ
jgi:hypothetical protein